MWRHLTVSFILFQKLLVTPCAVAPYPCVLRPTAPLLFTRVANAAVQAFGDLFVNRDCAERRGGACGRLRRVRRSGQEERGQPGDHRTVRVQPAVDGDQRAGVRRG